MDDRQLTADCPCDERPQSVAPDKHGGAPSPAGQRLVWGDLRRWGRSVMDYRLIGHWARQAAEWVISLPRLVAGRRLRIEGAHREYPAYRLTRAKLDREYAELSSRCAKLEDKNGALQLQLQASDHYAALLREELACRAARQAPAESAGGGPESKRFMDLFYVAFENRFRGSREVIRNRLKVYLPFLRESPAGRDAASVLDVGCGRGEWLELLRDKGFTARGVDSNQLMIELCKERELDAACGDALAFLRGLPDASLGAVTGFHIVEHLPFEALMQFLYETARVLKSGGVAIFETPNPQNIQTGACNFYFDPTHRKPLPSPLLQFLAESCGLARTEVLDLHPPSGHLMFSFFGVARRFEELFYGPQDYAVIGWKA